MEDLASKKLQRDLASNKFAMFLEQVGVHTKGGEKKKRLVRKAGGSDGLFSLHFNRSLLQRCQVNKHESDRKHTPVLQNRAIEFSTLE